MIQVKIKLFSHIKYALGQDEMILEFPPDATTEDLENKIRMLGEGHINNLPVRIAVNQEFISAPQKLENNDEIALIPPVQGG
jgi:molybdopterin converting factor small subunit